ncbi:MAG: hypothetical protein L3J89_11360 [Gammaproteobacteria bacterium]|nr:hypothetical protein [Gammaproteobacteria bacterium]
MKCPDITGLYFSLTGKKAIERIRQKQRLANVLSSVLAGSVLLEIFVGNGELGGANNILKKDWDVWAKSMRSVPTILRRIIEDIAREQLLEPMPEKERKFWEAVAHGCK